MTTESRIRRDEAGSGHGSSTVSGVARLDYRGCSFFSAALVSACISSNCRLSSFFVAADMRSMKRMP